MDSFILVPGKNENLLASFKDIQISNQTIASLELTGNSFNNLYIDSDGDGNFDYSLPPQTDVITSVIKSNKKLRTIKSYILHQNHPNPFNPTTSISYELPERSHIKIEIFNSLGQKVAELVNSEQNAGFHNTVWNANVGSGIYLYQITAQSIENPENRFVQTRKMILMK